MPTVPPRDDVVNVGCVVLVEDEGGGAVVVVGAALVDVVDDGADVEGVDDEVVVDDGSAAAVVVVVGALDDVGCAAAEAWAPAIVVAVDGVEWDASVVAVVEGVGVVSTGPPAATDGAGATSARRAARATKVVDVRDGAGGRTAAAGPSTLRTAVRTAVPTASTAPVVATSHSIVERARRTRPTFPL